MGYYSIGLRIDYMSNRFHSKYHRTNHHTDKSATNPDSGYDPIASPEHPFKGIFCASGPVMINNSILQSQGNSINVLSSTNIIDLTGNSNITLSSIENAKENVIYFLTNISNFNVIINNTGNITIRGTSPLTISTKTTCCFKKIPFENKISLW